MKNLRKRSWILLVLFCGLAPPVLAQTVTATLTGTVADQSGAAIKGVKVTATNEATRVEYTTETNEQGIYAIAPLPVGKYVVRAESDRFKSVATNPVTLESGQIARVNLQLELGQVTETIKVEAVAPILQTDSSSVGEVISSSTIEALPLNGRNFNQLTLIIPGSVTNDPGQFSAAKNTVSAFGRPNVNGQRTQANSYTLDGVDMNESLDNLLPYQPSPDALAEVRIETNNYSAEFGNVAGAVVSSVLKSGTNEINGSAFEFLRNDALDANSWGNNRSGAKKAELSQHIFGATLGGPLKKDELFFFADYQGTVVNQPGGITGNVAPAEWRRGDFSALLAQGVFIRDPRKSGSCNASDRTACFPGNIIPQDRFSPIARAILADTARYPLPSNNLPAGSGNLAGEQSLQTRNHQFDVKLDARPSPDNSLFVRFSYDTYRSGGDQTIMPLQPVLATTAPTQSVALGWSRTLSSTAVNELLIGYNRVKYAEADEDWAGVGQLNATYGIPGGQSLPGMTAINVGSGLDPIGAVAGRTASAVNSDRLNQTYQLSEKLSILKGRHYLKLGGTLLHYRQRFSYAGNEGLLGHLDYTGNFTGFGFADFLLDQLSAKGKGGAVEPFTQLQNRIGVFVQDDFKVQRNLTLNVGLRWAYTSPLVEKDDRQANFDLQTGKELFAGKDGNSRALYDPYYGGFEPRVGFAWTPSQKTVVRGAYGISQYMEGTGANLRLTANPPFFFETRRTYDASSGPGTGTIGFTDVRPVGNEPVGLVRIFDPNLRPQFTQQWNLFFEYQLNSATSGSIGYVGHHATHLVVPIDFNQPLPGTGPASTWAPAQQRRPLYSVAPLIEAVSGTASIGRSNYNALQASVRRRAAQGLEFLASYTLSKAMSDNIGYYGGGWGSASIQGFYYMDGATEETRKRDYGPSYFDARHAVTLSGYYDLPWGKGRTKGNDWTGMKSFLLAGWTIDSAFQAHTGFPITVVDSRDNSLRATRSFQRPNLVGNPRPANQDMNHWIDYGAFQQAAPGTFGNSPVGVIRGPGYWNWDLGISKVFHLDSRRYFTFRAEAFNVLNHPNFWMVQHAGPDFADPTTFGTLNSTVGNQRIVEFAIKLNF
jgi:carboxypeptidase family protein